MIAKFIQLQWKAFFRSASMNTNLAIKIIVGIFGAFYLSMILLLGVAAFYLLQEKGYDPLEFINQYIFYWWLFDLVFRYFLQKPPVMWVRPLLNQPIKKKTITRYLLGRSCVSFFNIYPAFFFLPFSIALAINGYSIVGILAWHLAIIAITYFNNFLNLIVNDKDAVFIGVATLLVALIGLQYFQIINIPVYTQPFFQSLYELLWMALLPILALYFIQHFVFKHYLKAMYLDDAIKTRQGNRELSDYTWLNRFGEMGVFLKNDLRLILRNKRAKNTVWMSFFFLFYGLLFFTNPQYNTSNYWLLFSGVFISGSFMLTFGGYVPSWDSAHYPFMMSQNIRYKEYLTSKWWLMVIGTILSMILSLPYLFLGVKYYMVILMVGIFNVGVNAYVTLWAGAYVKTPIDLQSAKKPFGDKNAFNLKTILISLPKLFIPFVIYFIFNYFFGEQIAFISIALIGILGLFFRNTVFNIIEKTYKKEKYDTIKAYKQKV